jgi:tape measure domain-containing protein
MANEQAQYIIELKDLVSSKLDAMNSRLDATNSKFNNVQQKAEGGLGLGKLGAIAGGLFAFSKIQEYGSEILAVGTKYESLGIQMANLTGSAEAGANMFAKIREDALVSPFGVDELATANTMLVSTGLSAEQARGDILALSNAVAYAGKGNDELIRMSANMQQIKNIGKASALDIKQFGYAGINIYGALAKATGKSTAEVKGMEISYELLSKSLRIAQEEGGAFYGGLSSMANSTSVQLSNLGDVSKEMFNDLFLAAKPFIDVTISGLSSIIQWVRDSEIFFKALSVSIGLVGGAWLFMNTQMLISKGMAVVWAAQYGIFSVGLLGLQGLFTLTGLEATIMWGAITGGITLIIAGLIAMYYKFEDFRAFIDGIVNVIVNLYKITFNVFKAIANGIKSLFGDEQAKADMYKNLDDAGKNMADIFYTSFSAKVKENKRNDDFVESLFAPNSLINTFSLNKQNDPLSKSIKGYTKLNQNSTTKINQENNTKLAKTYENKITNITIGKLVEGLSVHVQETKEIAPKLKEMIARYLISVTDDISIGQGQN